MLNNPPTTQLKNHTFFDRFCNSTNTQFSKSEIARIEKSFKHNINTNFSTSSYEILEDDTKLAPSNNEYKYLAAKNIKTEFPVKNFELCPN